MASDLVYVGKILGAHGVQGYVRVKSFTTEPTALKAYSPLQDQEGQRRFDLLNIRLAKGHIIARLEGITSREAAENLKGLKLFAKRTQFPKVEEEEYYHVDLLNMVVLNQIQEKIGYVKAILNCGANDILEIQNEEKQNFTVPFIQQAVPEVDIEAKKLIINTAFLLSSKKDIRTEPTEKNG